MAKFERKSGKGRDSGRGQRRGSRAAAKAAGTRPSLGGRKSRFTKRGTGQGRSTRKSDRITMHETICDKCAKKCEVPFKPTSSKPVYCSNCFSKDDSGGKGKSNTLEQINSKLDKIMKALDIN
jgi:CxxC-x17-CxxC domain-containing protein|tara:strand:- start:2395 stop:2763 length:369 start_codon:yes stop_codon:yes gene_type:complete